MHYLELVLSVIAAAVTLGFFVYHLFRKQKEAIHYLFAFSALAASLFYSLIFVYLFPQDVLPQLQALRMLAAMLLLMISLWCVLTETYPFVENKPALLAFLLAGIPGLAVAALTASTDWIIADAGAAWSYREGGYMPFYIAAVIAYCTAIPVILLSKSIFTRNRSFSAELAYFFAGTVVTMTAFFAFPLLVVRGAIDQTLCAQGMLVSAFTMTVLFHYAVLDFSTIDFRRFFKMTLYWLLIFALLCVPVYLILQYKNLVPGMEQVPIAGIAFVLFVYMFFVFKYLRPRIEQLLQKRYQGLSEKLNNSILPLTDYAKEGESQSWNEFYGDSIAKLLENFSIRHGVLLVLDSKKRSYKPVFISDQFTIPDITPELQQCLDILKSTMSISMLYTDYRIRHLRQTVLAQLETGRIDIAMPFFNYENQMIGVLLLSKMSGNRTYTNAYISILELYRIQFQQQMMSIIVLENAKEKQAIEHDKMVIQSIRKMVIPATMGQIEGIRVSSLHIQNSEQGGDYFDSVALDENRLFIFLSDSTYSGIDSVFTSLQLYSAMHTPTKYYSSPDKIHNIMNWLLATSSLASSPVSAFTVIYNSTGELQYSGAAGNPLLLYSPRSDSFVTFTTKGIPLGVKNDTAYESGLITPAQGSIGVLYSSGLTASINEAGDTYSADMLKGAVMANKFESPAVITRAIYDNYKSFIGDKKQISDVTIIVFKV